MTDASDSLSDLDVWLTPVLDVLECKYDFKQPAATNIAAAIKACWVCEQVAQ
jgi:hypothetical protein